MVISQKLFLYACVPFAVFLTMLCDVVNAAVHYHRYVCLCELLLIQRVSSTPCCCLDSCTPAGKIQLSLPLYVQSSETRDKGNKQSIKNRSR